MKKVLIQDAIHGVIIASPLAQSLMDTPEMQRLRWIKQLGLSNLVYPTATHDRFSHALGVMCLANMLGKHLGLPKEDLQLLEASALLHDVGHTAFSHTLEHVIIKRAGLNHKEVAVQLLKGRLVTFPEVPWEYTAPGVLEKYGLDPAAICDIISGHYGYLGEIISSNLDVDTIDYLLRDTHFTGVAAGTIDKDRLMHTFILADGHLAVSSKGIDAAEGFLMAKALAFGAVYYHKTVRIVELMLANAVDRAIDLNILDARDLYRMTDWEVIGCLLNTKGYPSNIMRRVLNRNLFKRVYWVERKELTQSEINVYMHKLGKWEQWQKYQQEIASKAGVPDGYVIVDAPLADFLREGMSCVEKTNINVLTSEGLVDLADISPVAVALLKRQIPRYLIQVATVPQFADKVRKVATDLLP